MRIAIALFMMVHGLAHLPGFMVPWRLGALDGVPYHTTLFTGRVDVGDTGIRAVGMLWLIVAVSFALVAVAALLDRRWWFGGAIVVSSVSLALCAAELPAARFGLVMNGVLLILLAASRHSIQPGGRLVP